MEVGQNHVTIFNPGRSTRHCISWPYACSVLHRLFCSIILLRFYTPPPPPNTHYKIARRWSPISLGTAIKATPVSLGIHRRMQTVYFPHSSVVAGKILKVKELVEAKNVSAHMGERRPPRGYRVKGAVLSFCFH